MGIFNTHSFLIKKELQNLVLINDFGTSFVPIDSFVSIWVTLFRIHLFTRFIKFKISYIQLVLVFTQKRYTKRRKCIFCNKKKRKGNI